MLEDFFVLFQLYEKCENSPETKKTEGNHKAFLKSQEVTNLLERLSKRLGFGNSRINFGNNIMQYDFKFL